MKDDNLDRDETVPLASHEKNMERMSAPGKGKPKSKVWRYMMTTKESDGTVARRCVQCNHRFQLTTGTGSLRTHLQEKHGILLLKSRSEQNQHARPYAASVAQPTGHASTSNDRSEETRAEMHVALTEANAKNVTDNTQLDSSETKQSTIAVDNLLERSRLENPTAGGIGDNADRTIQESRKRRAESLEGKANKLGRMHNFLFQPNAGMEAEGAVTLYHERSKTAAPELPVPLCLKVLGDYQDGGVCLRIMALAQSALSVRLEVKFFSIKEAKSKFIKLSETATAEIVHVANGGQNEIRGAMMLAAGLVIGDLNAELARHVSQGNKVSLTSRLVVLNDGPMFSLLRNHKLVDVLPPETDLLEYARRLTEVAKEQTG